MSEEIVASALDYLKNHADVSNIGNNIQEISDQMRDEVGARWYLSRPGRSIVDMCRVVMVRAIYRGTQEHVGPTEYVARVAALRAARRARARAAVRILGMCRARESVGEDADARESSEHKISKVDALSLGIADAESRYAGMMAALWDAEAELYMSVV